MALVAYGASDDDITDSEEENGVNESALKGSVESTVTDDNTSNDRVSIEEGKSILAGLPAPKSVRSNPGEDELEDMVKRRFATDIPKPKTKGGRIQISVPQLPKAADSDEEDEVAPPKRLNTSKATTFLTSLPAPKHMTAKEPGRKLLPYSLSKKPVAAAKKPRSTPVSSGSAATSEPVLESDESDGEQGASFFSLETDSRLKPAEVAPPLPPLADRTRRKRSFAIEGSSLAGPWQTHDNSLPSQDAYASVMPDYSEEGKLDTAADERPEHVWPEATVIPTEAEKIGISEDELVRLAGRRGRNKEAMKLVDVHADDGLDPSQLLKNVTQEQTHHSHKKGDDMPSGQQRRKHQITYLAFQAKEREQELQNQWAQNRSTRQQTQNKYGF